MFTPPPVGHSIETRHIVAAEDTADRLGNPGVHVLASPRLLNWVEDTTALLWVGYRDSDEMLLGTEFHLNHVGAAQVGATVTIRGWIESVDGRRVRYGFEGRDERGKICHGWSENFLMPLAKLQARLGADAVRSES
ncbi:MAG: hypothetical protein JOZ39_06835 [Chloroflexi bacterium]|nr:hypothetical protein [Chloroflexota bacterium]